MIISTTKFKLKSWTLYAEFFVDTLQVVKQAKAAGGIIKMRIRPIELRTLSVWKTKADMLKFRNSAAHLASMKKSDQFGSIQTVTWKADTLPTWKEAIAKLETNSGR